MLSLQDFVTTNNGVAGVGNTPQNKGQCTGLVSLWMDNLEIPHEFGNAKDLLNNANRQYCDVIINDPNNLNQFPASGDVVVWGGTWGGGYGHTGVVITADGTTLTVFEQNNPTGHAPQILKHLNYSGVLGWLHPKVAFVVQNPTTPPPPPAPTQQGTTLSDDEQRALQVLKDFLSTAKKSDGTPIGGNLEGTTRMLTGSAYPQALSLNTPDSDGKMPVVLPNGLFVRLGIKANNLDRIAKYFGYTDENEIDSTLGDKIVATIKLLSQKDSMPIFSDQNISVKDTISAAIGKLSKVYSSLFISPGG